jgi:NADH dehydrogenase FAD-containing subunit
MAAVLAVGGGPTGIEVAAELHDVIHEDLTVGGLAVLLHRFGALLLLLLCSS